MKEGRVFVETYTCANRTGYVCSINPLPRSTLRGFLFYEDKILAGFPLIIPSPADMAACYLAWELSKFYPPFTRASWHTLRSGNIGW
jgi:hypothetical protein